MNSFSDGDLRKDSYIVKEKVMVNGKNLYRPFGKIALTSANDPSTDNTKFGHAFRVSEAILMYAEAKAVLYKNGNGAAKADAVSALNKLREKRFASAKYAPIPDMDADNLIKFVREERRRELCFEAFRWFDLRRYGMPQIKHEWNDMETSTTPKVYVLEDGDNAYVLPFPHNVIEKNSDLIQNPLAPIRNPQ